MSQANTDVGPYAERQNSEGTINGKFITRKITMFSMQYFIINAKIFSYNSTRPKLK